MEILNCNYTENNNLRLTNRSSGSKTARAAELIVSRKIWRFMMLNIATIKMLITSLLFSLMFPLLSLSADNPISLSKRQSLYVPAYSHIYSGNNERPFLLAVILSIRNIDPNHRIKIKLLDYYDTEGKLEKKYIETPVILNPLGSLRYVVPEKDKKGGSGANFIVEWESDRFVNPPIVESIMIGTQTQQGVSFTSRGQEIYKSE